MAKGLVGYFSPHVYIIIMISRIKVITRSISVMKLAITVFPLNPNYYRTNAHCGCGDTYRTIAVFTGGAVEVILKCLG